MTRSTRLLAALLPLLAAACAPVQPAQAPTGTPGPGASASIAPAPASVAPSATPVASYALAGKVSDEGTATVTGALVSAVLVGASSPAATATVGADGGYSLALPPGRYNVTATKPGWTSRSQTLTLAGNATLNFGGHTPAYFISDTPEIASTLIQEDAPGGPLTVTCTLSEPITASSQANFSDRFQVFAPNGKLLLRANQASDPRLVTSASWDASGQIFKLRYAAAHYLASGASTAATYRIALRQGHTAAIDPVTNEPTYEDMGIVDADGKALGYGRADYAFVAPTLDFDPNDLNNTSIAASYNARAWRLTHQSSFSFAAAKDLTPPALLSARIHAQQSLNGSSFDVLELHFNKAMNVVQDPDNLQFTLLDKAKQLVALKAGADASGANLQPLTNTPVLNVRFSLADPTVVYLDFGRDTFLNARSVDITLGPDCLDPVGNAPDPKANHLLITN